MPKIFKRTLSQVYPFPNARFWKFVLLFEFYWHLCFSAKISIEFSLQNNVIEFQVENHFIGESAKSYQVGLAKALRSPMPVSGNSSYCLSFIGICVFLLKSQ